MHDFKIGDTVRVVELDESDYKATIWIRRVL